MLVKVETVLNILIYLTETSLQWLVHYSSSLESLGVKVGVARFFPLPLVEEDKPCTEAAKAAESKTMRFFFLGFDFGDVAPGPTL